VLTSIVGVVILLGGLIFFHEFGHYAIAKLFGVKVEVFSLGFGKKLFRRKVGETEYCLSLFPLGGYVKLMGDDPYKAVPPAEADRAFSTQKLYKRFLIVAAGPIANLLLAFLLFVAVFWFGQPTASTRIGAVIVNSSAWDAGFRPKDRILDVFGTPVSNWNDLEDFLKAREGQKGEVRIERGNTELRLPVTVEKIRSKNEYGEDELVGGIKGLSPSPLDPVIGVSDTNSPAYAAGLRTGDQIIKIGSRTIILFEDLNEALTGLWAEGQPVTVTLQRRVSPDSEKTNEMSVNLVFPKKPASDEMTPLGLVAALGMYPVELFVKSLSHGSPAETAGLKIGDRIAKVGDQVVFNFDTIVDAVQEQGGKDQSVKLVIEREGHQLSLDIKPMQTTQEDPFTRQKVQMYLLGYIRATAYHDPDTVKIIIRQPVALVQRAYTETMSLAKRMIVSIVKLVVGKVSVKNLGGPVLIASVAGKSLDAGVIPFLHMMALISINLFLLNLFPIPILDGGHLLFFLIEGVKGKPVSIRTMEIANQVGMVFILMLVVLTLFNDISRIILH
jgi:regulator of sigma E protease